jgi:glycosyltransferase involved in cell wall biosynthesis
MAAVIRAFLRARNCDYLILDFTSRDFWLLTLMKLVLPFTRVKLVTLDLLLTRPGNFKDRMLLHIKRVLLRRAHKFIVYQKDTVCYECMFGIREERFHYVPYKVNALELIERTQTGDGGYIFCGGQSRRDFSTMIEAVRDSEYYTRIVTGCDTELTQHGTYLDDISLPECVSIIRLDGSVEPFVKEMAAARLVVIPIIRGAMTQSGIAVSLMAMAMGKCVIATYGPGISDVLPLQTAVIVPPGSASALRAAIDKVWFDDSLRYQIAEAGRKHALELGGTERLLRDVSKWIRDDYHSEASCR